MSDFFLSYAHEDVEAAATLAHLLEANGLSVWWNRRMVAGDRFHSVIDQELEKAKAVIVLWSPKSLMFRLGLGRGTNGSQRRTSSCPSRYPSANCPSHIGRYIPPRFNKTEAELDQLAQLCLERRGRHLKVSASAVAASTPAIKFSPKSS